METANGSTPSARPALSLADVEAFGPRAAHGGTERVSRCPICQSSERAFHFNTASGVYNCKRASCGASGKLSDFWQERPKMNRQQRARNALHAAFNLKPATDSPTPEMKHQSMKQEPSAWLTLWDAAQPVGSTPSALYLASRGIPEPIAEAADVRAMKLFGRPCVAFPFHNRDGQVVAFQARAIDGKPDGHRAQGSKKAGVFLTSPDALQDETIIICEAPIDALSLAACGFPAIALGGVVAPDWIFAALAFKRVYLALDNDQSGAGDQATVTLAPDLVSFGAKAVRLAPHRAPDTDKSDWNMMLQESGAPALRAWLTARLSYVEYFQSL